LLPLSGFRLVARKCRPLRALCCWWLHVHVVSSACCGPATTAHGWARLPRDGKVTCLVASPRAHVWRPRASFKVLSSCCAITQMRAGDELRQDGGGSGLTGPEERARRSVEGVSLGSGPGQGPQQQQQQRQGSGEAAVEQPVAGELVDSAQTVGCDLWSEHQDLLCLRHTHLQRAAELVNDCILNSRGADAHCSDCNPRTTQGRRRLWQRSHPALLPSRPGGAIPASTMQFKSVQEPAACA
jgi:hypothetical protein